MTSQSVLDYVLLFYYFQDNQSGGEVTQIDHLAIVGKFSS